VFCQAVANELGLNFISVKGPELLSMVSSHVSLLRNLQQSAFSALTLSVGRQEEHLAYKN